MPLVSRDWRQDPRATRTALTEITVAQARFREIMSWEDWKAKARSLERRCSECGSPSKAEEREVMAATGRCQSCMAKSEAVTGSWSEVSKAS